MPALLAATCVASRVTYCTSWKIEWRAGSSSEKGSDFIIKRDMKQLVGETSRVSTLAPRKYSRVLQTDREPIRILSNILPSPKLLCPLYYGTLVASKEHVA